MKVLIVDDELPARNRIISLLKKYNKNFNIEVAVNGETAIQKIREFEPELLFLDINLNDISGLDVIQSIDKNSNIVIIFVSAYDNYATKAFDHEAIDFLLKPFKNSRFERTMNKILSLSLDKRKLLLDEKIEKLIRLNEKQEVLESIPVRIGNRTILVDTAEIQYIAADRYYAEIFTGTNKYVIRQSLNKLIELIDGKSFCRIHRSTIINKKFVQEIIQSDFSEIDIRMKDGKLFRVSRGQKKEVFKFLGIA